MADGAADNWAYPSSDALPSGEEAVDFFHAGEHLHAAIATVYGDGTHETQFRYATLRDTLRDEGGGVDKIIRALKHLASKHPRKTSLATGQCLENVLDLFTRFVFEVRSLRVASPA